MLPSATADWKEVKMHHTFIEATAYILLAIAVLLKAYGK